MTTRDQGRRTVRTLTTALALAGVVGAGGLGAAAYSGIVEAKAAQTQTHDGTTTSGDDASSTTSGDSSTSSGVGAGTGSSQTGSSGS